MIIQGSNVPLTIKFDSAVDTLPELVVSLWSDDIPYIGAPLKQWEASDMTIAEDTAVCPITEEESRNLPRSVWVEAKGLDGNGETVFWTACEVDVLERRDRVITLVQDGG